MLFGCSDQKQTPNATAQTPDAATASMPDVNAPAFNADSAFALLKRQVAFGPRVPGTAGHAAQLAWMQGYLAGRADTVITQHIAHIGEHGQQIPMANVFARFNPDAQQRILFIAHWDTRPNASAELTAANRAKPIAGANDGASGVAVLLMLSDMFAKQAPEIGVDLLFTDGEDWEQGDMYIGAKHFAVWAGSAGYRPMYGVLIDMIGDRNPQYLIESNSQQYAPEVVDRVWRTAESLGLAHVFLQKPGIRIEDDHIALNAAGIRTADVIDFDYGPGNAYWHTLQDTVEHTSPTGLDAVGRVLAYLAYSGG
jgi:Zn-dependent M28 family amino/carboxypeptidase